MSPASRGWSGWRPAAQPCAPASSPSLCVCASMHLSCQRVQCTCPVQGTCAGRGGGFGLQATGPKHAWPACMVLGPPRKTAAWLQRPNRLARLGSATHVEQAPPAGRDGGKKGKRAGSAALPGSAQQAVHADLASSTQGLHSSRQHHSHAARLRSHFKQAEPSANIPCISSRQARTADKRQLCFSTSTTFPPIPLAGPHVEPSRQCQAKLTCSAPPAGKSPERTGAHRWRSGSLQTGSACGRQGVGRRDAALCMCAREHAQQRWVGPAALARLSELVKLSRSRAPLA